MKYIEYIFKIHSLYVPFSCQRSCYLNHSIIEQIYIIFFFLFFENQHIYNQGLTIWKVVYTYTLYENILATFDNMLIKYLSQKKKKLIKWNYFLPNMYRFKSTSYLSFRPSWNFSRKEIHKLQHLKDAFVIDLKSQFILLFNLFLLLFMTLIVVFLLFMSFTVLF